MTKSKIGIGVIVLVVIALAVVVSNVIKFAIIPELDNRITYFDKVTDMSEFVLGNGNYENDKFICGGLGYIRAYMYGLDEVFLVSATYPFSDSSNPMNCQTKKDFSRLSVFVRYKNTGGGVIGFGRNLQVSQVEGAYDVWHNVEIVPDNLNLEVYDIYLDGEYLKRIIIPDGTFGVYIYSGTGSRTYPANVILDYIKYIPLESFTIKSDEVWVKEVRTGGSYSYSDLNWEMIGFQSQIRPATIRNLADQTEVLAPQIYVELINSRLVTIEPNTIHTFFYRTKWVSGLDSSCQGNLDQVEVKQSDGSWKCEGYVKETPIIQQCQTANDCPILPDCESQSNLISCNNNLCDFSAFSPACKNQLITYQEKVIEIENTKFVPLPSGTNSFYCFFDKTITSCDIGEKKLSVSSPSYTCALPSDPSEIVAMTDSNIDCWISTLTFDGQFQYFKNNEINNNIGYGIKAELSSGATLKDGKTRDDWSSVAKITLPDDFLEIKTKELGNKFVLQNSNDKITFTINNKLGFGINGGYTIQTQNLALEGGVVLRDNSVPLFLKSGDNDVTYDFTTSQLGTIVDIIGVYGKITTDKDYTLKSSQNGRQKFLIITKEIVTTLPADIEKVKPVFDEVVIEKKISFLSRIWNSIIAFFNNLFK